MIWGLLLLLPGSYLSQKRSVKRARLLRSPGGMLAGEAVLAHKQPRCWCKRPTTMTKSKFTLPRPSQRKTRQDEVAPASLTEKHSLSQRGGDKISTQRNKRQQNQKAGNNHEDARSRPNPHLAAALACSAGVVPPSG